MQEASDRVREWTQEGWQQGLRRNQFFAVREPGQVQSITSGDSKSLQWHVCKIRFPQKRAGLTDIMVLSVRMRSLTA